MTRQRRKSSKTRHVLHINHRLAPARSMLLLHPARPIYRAMAAARRTGRTAAAGATAPATTGPGVWVGRTTWPVLWTVPLLQRVTVFWGAADPWEDLAGAGAAVVVACCSSFLEEVGR